MEREEQILDIFREMREGRLKADEDRRKADEDRRKADKRYEVLAKEIKEKKIKNKMLKHHCI